MILEEILQNKKKEIETRKTELPPFFLKSQAELASPSKDFASALAKPGMSLIAEVKKASPSAGLMREDFDAGKIAVSYEKNGASAISLLTESKYFQGSLEHLGRVRSLVSLPLLRKDFIIDEYQIYESKVFHADAILLIVAALTQSELGAYLRLAGELGMDVLVEVHDRVELEQAAEVGASIIGINNRSLRTLEVDLRTSFELVPLVPPGKTVVAESGIHSRQDVVELEKLGVDAILVGEALMRSDDIGAKIKELLGE
jgi:indole-3-glycerol phosphate synthase